ncbi:MAG: hypothetical protein LBE20_06545 [Deltaproteobacteria bacterium]|jgi:hypothetical protein|nr:hypothetical protein [Deltaproteobacteria bacterium]
MNKKILYITKLTVTLLFLVACSQTKEAAQDIKESLFGSTPDEPIICKTSFQIDKNFINYLQNRANQELLTRVAIVAFNVPENFTSIATARKDYGNYIANRFKEYFLKYSPSGVFELLSTENLTLADRKHDFEYGNYRAISLAKRLGYNTLIAGQLNPITNDSELYLMLKIIDLESEITLWNGEIMVQDVERNKKNKNILKSNQAVFYFNERITLAAECAVQNIVYKK